MAAANPDECGCGCCAGITSATPLPVDNRPGLPRVRYRPGSYPEFRASLHAALASGAHPALAGLTTRDDDDFTVALLDGAACLADVLTFYTERLANESYLRTAREPTSLRELSKLVGYRQRPGVAASTHLAFHVEPAPPAQVAAATSPFREMRMPASVTIGAGVPVRSVPGPGEQPQTFETTESIEARPEWNLLRPVQTKQTVLTNGATAMYVKGVTTNLRPGDLLLFVKASPADAQTWPVASVKPQREDDRTLVTWDQPLLKPGPWVPHVMRKRLSVFGHNAPMWSSLSDTFKADYGCPKDCDDWPFYLITAWPHSGDGSSYLLRVDVDGSHPEITPGSHIVLGYDDVRRHFTVAKVAELSRAEYAVTGKVTRLKLAGEVAKWALYEFKVRETTVYAMSEQLDLAEEPDTSPVQHAQLDVVGDVSGLPPGRTLLVAGGGPVEVVTLKSATALPGGTTSLELTGALAGQYDRRQVMIFANVARATHGETVHQILGDGQAVQEFQAFELKHAPLTYLPSDDPSGCASSLHVRVNDVAWPEAATLYRGGPGDRVFVTREAPSGELVVAFGDGVHGSRLPTGQHNVRAVYRKGLGTGGNLPAGALSQLTAPPLGVTGVTNPVPAEGGADPDTVDRARVTIPLSTRTLGRAVSLADYADYARSFAGVAKAHAAVVPIHNVRTIVVTVAGDDGLVPDAVRARLATSLRGYGDPLAPVLVLAHRQVPFVVVMRVRRHPDHGKDTVLRTVADRLLASFGSQVRDFGQPVHRSEVVLAAHGAPGVVAVDLDVLARTDLPPTDDWLVASGPEVVEGAVEGAELLLLADDPRPWLSEMP